MKIQNNINKSSYRILTKICSDCGSIIIFDSRVKSRKGNQIALDLDRKLHFWSCQDILDREIEKQKAQWEGIAI